MVEKRFRSAAVLWNWSRIFLLEPEKTGRFGSSSEWINAEQFLLFWLKNYNISLICMCKRKVTGIKRFIFIKNKLKNNWWHRLISRDRPTKTGSLCLCRPFFYVAALNVCIWRVVDVGWGGTISEIFEKKINDWFFVRLLYSNREERWDIFLFVQTEFTDLLFTGFEPKSFDLK